MSNVVLPPIQFAQPFTKALRLVLSYKGDVTVTTHTQRDGAWSENVRLTGDLSDGPLKLELGVDRNDARGLAVVTPDGWLKPWGPPKIFSVGKTEAYPFGQLDYPGGYAANEFAVPLYGGSFQKKGGKATLALESTRYGPDGKRTVVAGGSTLQWQMDSKLPLLVAVIWLEEAHGGVVRLNNWNGASETKVVTI
jgi:hypothetical protein